MNNDIFFIGRMNIMKGSAAAVAARTIHAAYCCTVPSSHPILTNVGFQHKRKVMELALR